MPQSEKTLDDKIQAQGNFQGYGTLKVAKAIYNFGIDGGVSGAITPKFTVLLPKNAVIVGGTVNSTTAVTSGGAGTVSIGTTAGSSAASLLGVTAKGSLSANALVNAVPVFGTPVKLSAAGYINFTVATADLTAGVIEVAVFYYEANN